MLNQRQHKMHRIFFLFVFFLTSTRGQREGQSCIIEDYDNAFGICTVIDACEIVLQDFRTTGIVPKFCSYDDIKFPIICCRQVSNILHSTATQDQDERPIWDNAVKTKDRRRVSERKCEEYSKDPDRIYYITLIPGGTDAKLGEFPHMAAIGWADKDGYKFNCGGTLISPRYVLTAAHCSRDINAQTPDPVIVRLGDTNIDSTIDGSDPVDVAIRRFIQHPDYASPKVYNDIALIELVTNVTLGPFIRPACLWNRTDLGQHKTVFATGWGKLSFHSQETAKVLQKVTLSLLDTKICNEKLKSLISRNWRFGFIDSQICAGDLKGGKDTCEGDSGGPIQVKYEDDPYRFHIIGITSFGKNCAVVDRPAVYTRVSSYIDWIERIVWPGE